MEIQFIKKLRLTDGSEIIPYQWSSFRLADTKEMWLSSAYLSNYHTVKMNDKVYWPFELVIPVSAIVSIFIEREPSLRKYIAMNNSSFTLRQFKKILPQLIARRIGIFYSTDCSFELSSDNLEELDSDGYIFIHSIIEEGNFTIIHFHVEVDFGDEDYENHYFKSIHETESVKQLIAEL